LTELARIETVVFLQTVELLASCSAEQILRISAITRQHLLPAGEVIYREGGPADALYFVVRGQVSVLKSSGDERVLGAGQTFGVTEILSGRLRTGSATASEETLVLAIEADDFFDLLAHNIEIVKALFRQLLDKAPPPATRESP